MKKPCLSAILIWSLVFVTVAGFIRGPEGKDKRSITREELWRLKLTAPSAFDIVAGGDSRTLYDMSPAAVQTAFPGMRVFNFAFNYVGMTPEYLKAIEDKLNPTSARKIIVLGITPRELTPLNLRVNGFAEERDRPKTDKLFNVCFPGLRTFLRPMILGSTVQRVMGKLRWDQNFYRDGWMSARLEPRNNEISLSEYRGLFKGNQVSESIVANLMETVRQWKGEGIHVYAFRPPTVSEMVAIENSTSGFDEKEFVSRFEAAGGQWIDVPLGKYEVSDGSHLVPESAQQFSQDMGRLLMDCEGTGTEASSQRLLKGNVR